MMRRQEMQATLVLYHIIDLSRQGPERLGDRDVQAPADFRLQSKTIEDGCS